MHFVPQILFVAILSTAIWLFTKNILQIRRNIFLGVAEYLNDNKPLRWKHLLLLALGQKKMFRNPLVAVMHLVIYAGFIIINIEVLEIILVGGRRHVSEPDHPLQPMQLVRMQPSGRNSSPAA